MQDKDHDVHHASSMQSNPKKCPYLFTQEHYEQGGIGGDIFANSIANYLAGEKEKSYSAVMQMLAYNAQFCG